MKIKADNKVLLKGKWRGLLFAATAAVPSSGSFGKVVSEILWGPGQILVKVVGFAFVYYILKWTNDVFEMGVLNSVLRLLTIIATVWMVLADIGMKMNNFLNGSF